MAFNVNEFLSDNSASTGGEFDVNEFLAEGAREPNRQARLLNPSASQAADKGFDIGVAQKAAVDDWVANQHGANIDDVSGAKHDAYARAAGLSGNTLADYSAIKERQEILDARKHRVANPAEDAADAKALLYKWEEMGGYDEPMTAKEWDENFVRNIPASLSKAGYNTIAGTVDIAGLGVNYSPMGQLYRGITGESLRDVSEGLSRGIRGLADYSSEAYGVDEDFEQSITGQLMGGAATVATGIATFGAGTAGMLYTEAIRDTEAATGMAYADLSQGDKDRAAFKGLVYSFFGGILERTGLKYVGGGKLKGFLAGKVKLPKGVLAKIFAGAGVEGLTESLQGQLLDTLSVLVEGDERDLIGWGVVKARLTEFAMGFVIGGGASVSMQGLSIASHVRSHGDWQAEIDAAMDRQMPLNSEQPQGKAFDPKQKARDRATWERSKKRALDNAKQQIKSYKSYLETLGDKDLRAEMRVRERARVEGKIAEMEERIEALKTAKPTTNWRGKRAKQKAAAAEGKRPTPFTEEGGRNPNYRPMPIFDKDGNVDDEIQNLMMGYQDLKAERDELEKEAKPASGDTDGKEAEEQAKKKADMDEKLEGMERAFSDLIDSRSEKYGLTDTLGQDAAGIRAFNLKLAVGLDPMEGATATDWKFIDQNYSDSETADHVLQSTSNPDMVPIALAAKHGDTEAQETYADQFFFADDALGDAEGILNPEEREKVLAESTREEREKLQADIELRVHEKNEKIRREASDAVLSIVDELARGDVEIDADDSRVVTFLSAMEEQAKAKGWDQDTKEARITEELIKAAENQGIGLEEIRAKVKNLKITGETSTEFIEDVLTYKIKLNQGQTPDTIYEEMGHVEFRRLKAAVGTKEAVAQVLKWKKGIEAETGEVTHGDTEGQLDEWLARKGVAWAIKNHQDQQKMNTLPEAIAAWMKRFVAKLKSVFADADLLRRLDAEGKLDPELKAFMQRAIGETEGKLESLQGRERFNPKTGQMSEAEVLEGNPDSAKGILGTIKQIIENKLGVSYGVDGDGNIRAGGFSHNQKINIQLTNDEKIELNRLKAERTEKNTIEQNNQLSEEFDSILRKALERAITKTISRTAGQTAPDPNARPEDAQAAQAILDEEVSFQIQENERDAAFYSQLERTLSSKLQGKAASIQQVKGLLSPKHGVKAEEVKWSGIEQWLDDNADAKGKVKTADLMEYVRNAGQVKFEEVTSGRAFTQGDEDLLADLEDREAEDQPAPTGFDPQYSSYVLPNGENYREVVLTMPSIFNVEEAKKLLAKGQSLIGMENGEPVRRVSNETLIGNITEFSLSDAESYTSSHFPDIPNYVAHMRLNEREDSEGNDGLFIEEIQSDRHQQARDKGYKGEWEAKVREMANVELPENPSRNWTPRMLIEAGVPQDVADSIHDGASSEGIADAPFRKDWNLQMFKRALRDAVASGKDWIGWTTGQTQADRYDLSSDVDTIKIDRETDARFVYITMVNNSDVMLRVNDEGHIEESNPSTYENNALSDVLGKELAMKIMNVEGGQVRPLKGADLKLGGEGMKGFYDKMLPSAVNKYVKKFGAKVEVGGIDQHIPDHLSFDKWHMEEYGEEFNALTKDSEMLGKRYDEYSKKWEVDHKSQPIHKVEITEAMRESVRQGQVSYQVVQTETAEFKSWFGDSKVVDENGEPLVVVHGGQADIESFDIPLESDSMSDAEVLHLSKLGAWFAGNTGVDKGASRRIADIFSLGTYGSRQGASVTPVYLQIENPKVFKTYTDLSDAVASSGLTAVGFRENLQDDYFDGIIIEESDTDFGGLRTDYVVFEPTQVKSSIGNRGSFENTDPRISYQVTETSEFKQWFGDSKVLDENGNPQILMHGTASDWDTFEKGAAVGGMHPTKSLGFFATPLEETAAWYAANAEKRGWGAGNKARVLKLYAAITNPYDISREDFYELQMPQQISEFKKKLLDAGHDGIKVIDDDGTVIEYVAFKPEQFKSATDNRGTFDPNDARITYQVEATMDDFTKENVSDIANKTGWMIFTAENPNAVQVSDGENVTRNEELRTHLEAQGLEHRQVVGRYEGLENPFLIVGTDDSRRNAAALAREYDQQSVLTHEGLVYQDGSLHAATGKTEVFKSAPKDYYTTMPDGTMFGMELDFSTKIEPEPPIKETGESGELVDGEIDGDTLADLIDKPSFQIEEDGWKTLTAKDLRGKKLFGFYADRMSVGTYTGLDPASGINIKMQGGIDYPIHHKGAAWAVSSDSMHSSLANAADSRDGIAVVIAYASGNITGNPTFADAYIAELKWAIESGKISKTAALKILNKVRKESVSNYKTKQRNDQRKADEGGGAQGLIDKFRKAALSKNGKLTDNQNEALLEYYGSESKVNRLISELKKAEVTKFVKDFAADFSKKRLAPWAIQNKTNWKTVEEFFDSLTGRGATFDSRGAKMFKTGKNVEGNVTAQKLGANQYLKEGMPDIERMIHLMEVEGSQDINTGDILGLVQIDKGQAGQAASASDIGVDEHKSYSKILKGKPYGKLPKTVNILDIFNPRGGYLPLAGEVLKFKDEGRVGELDEVAFQIGLDPEADYQRDLDAIAQKLSKEEAKRLAQIRKLHDAGEDVTDKLEQLDNLRKSMPTAIRHRLGGDVQISRRKTEKGRQSELNRRTQKAVELEQSHEAMKRKSWLRRTLNRFGASRGAKLQGQSKEMTQKVRDTLKVAAYAANSDSWEDVVKRSTKPQSLTQVEFEQIAADFAGLLQPTNKNAAKIEAAYYAVQDLMREGKYTMNKIRADRLAMFEKATDEIKEGVLAGERANNDAEQKTADAKKGLEERLTAWVDSGMTGMTAGFENIVRRIDGEQGGALWEFLYADEVDGVNASVDRKNSYMMEQGEFITTGLAKAFPDLVDKNGDPDVTAIARELAKLDARPAKATDTGIRFADNEKSEVQAQPVSKSEAMSIWLVLRQEGSRSTFRDQHAITDFEGFQRALEEYIGIDGMAVIDNVITPFYEDAFYDLNEVFKRVEGYDMDKVENYFRFMRESGFAGKDIEDAINPFAGFTEENSNSIDKGATMTRTENATSPFKFISALEVLTQSAGFNANYIGMAGLEKRLRYLHTNDEFKRAVRQKYGTSGGQQLRKAAESVIAGRIKVEGWGGRLLEGIRSVGITSVLALKPKIALTQLTSGIAGIVEMPAQEWVSWVSKIVENPTKHWNIIKGTPAMKDRMSRGQSQEVLMELNKIGRLSLQSGVLAKLETATRYSMALIKMGDIVGATVSAAPVYFHTYETVLAETGDVGTAKRKAEQAFSRSVNRSQQSPHLYARPQAYQNNAFMRVLYQFRSSPIQYLSETHMAVREYVASQRRLDWSPEKRARVAKQSLKAMFIYHIAMPQFFFAVNNAMIGLWLDDDERRIGYWQGMLSTLVFGNFGALPVYGDAIVATVSGLMDVDHFPVTVAPSGLQNVQHIEKHAKHLLKPESMDEFLDGAAHLLDFSGLGASTLKDGVQSTFDMIDEGDPTEMLEILGWSDHLFGDE